MTEATVEQRMYGHPFSWLLFSWVLLLVPTVAYTVQMRPHWEELHPALNAILNGSSAMFLFAGFLAIRRGRRVFHKQCMLAATTTSAVFLASYLARFMMTGAHRYPGTGVDKAIYLVVLMSHMVLAALLVPLALAALYYGLRGKLGSHKRIAKWAWPVWMYVSVTGVVVYLMLYPLAERWYGVAPAL